MTRVASPLSPSSEGLARGETDVMKDMLKRIDSGLRSDRPRRSTLNFNGMVNANETVSVALDYLGLMSPELLKFGKQD